ncbi:peptidase domain-containing ABC transporter [Photorhabdus laumondii]|uniref:ABC transporter ATP-binding protein n=2 Tax=Photorhabdus TaxID=29487 RepID=A0A329VGI9_9GAMM|nr:peptidase domain-containing ABC transporter [Photorhabdus laumondii]RAW90784.1 ABC transporter ATP-binding protein [Photorhabdus laumondii subsp. clarkei]
MFFRRKKIPVILQSEISECGLACLVMLAGYFGKRIDLAAARSIHEVTMDGMTLRNLVNAFEQVGMTSRASRVEIEDLHTITRPVILHWSFNHYVVLIKVNRKGAVIHDPAIGQRFISLRELSDKFTGVILEAWPIETFNKEPLEINVNVKDLFKGISGLGKILSGVLAISIVIELLSISVPAATQFTIDTLIRSNDIQGIYSLSIVVISALLAKSFFSVIRAITLMNLRYSLGVKWAEMFFNRVVSLKLPFFIKRHIGDISSRFQALCAIQESFDSNMISSALDAIVVFISIVVIINYSPILAIPPVFFSLFYAAIRIGLFNKFKTLKNETIIHESIQQSHFIESIRAITAIKMLNLDVLRRREWVNYVVNSTRSANRTFKMDLFTNTLGILLQGLSGVFILTTGAIYFDSGLSTGALFGVMLYGDMIVSRVIKLSDALSEFFLISMHCHRLTDVAVSPAESEGGEKFGSNISGSIIIKNLAYRYSQNQPYIFDGINLEILPGESVAIVGASGCGKSTLLNVLAGLYEPTNGEILINGKNISSMDKKSLRQKISFVMQDDKLLSGTIEKNITSFSEAPNHERMEECAYYAAIDDEIMKLPLGYETKIGDIGSTLSGGQRQRVAIARALYRRPSILLLDEATSNLDINNEKKITKAINALSITRVFIAHRPEMIKSADRIYNLDLKSWVNKNSYSELK